VVALAVVGYGAYAVYTGLGTLGDSLVRFSWVSFAAACALALGNYGLRFLKWEFYLARLGIGGIGKVDSFLTFLSGFVLTITPGKVGEVFKSWIVFETHGVPIAKTAPIVIAERVTDLIGIVVLIVLGSLGFSGGLAWAGIGAALVVLLLVVIASPTLSLGIVSLVERVPGRVGRLAPRLREAYASLATMLRPRNLAVPTLLSILAWSFECLALWVILRGFGEGTPVALCVFFYATSTLAGAVASTPGGLGVTEGALEKQMHDVGHVSSGTSAAAMMLVRFATLWFAVLLGFLALEVLKRRHPELGAGRRSISTPPPLADAAPP
jgi:glycosyltransferase 2 family protein